MRRPVSQHLADDVGKSLRSLLINGLYYVAFLKREHPILFRFRMGIHSIIDPELMENS